MKGILALFMLLALSSCNIHTVDEKVVCIDKIMMNNKDGYPYFYLIIKYPIGNIDRESVGTDEYYKTSIGDTLIRKHIE